ncbi:MPN527 family putative ECF transporter permease subunit [Candidatus Mycoplasma mahonii]|uniref:MPN527 family putative ECF transporter permease subunit n=1 Tax=Candidatus Mycoplasma mahonii TaxID=3004105 RepID=UPI0026F23199|nr:hypothetical protein [Candidatus Mycoplasma mahonii]WKX02612.1 hypothetical protein O3I44_00840 [Candidatus Mycoplasma mahonii]
MPYKNINFRIAFAGIFLGGGLLFQFLSKFMPLVPQLMDINLSLVFIVPIFFISGYWMGMMTLIIKYILGPAIGRGYNPPEMIGQTILFVAGLLFIHLLLIAQKARLIKNKYGMYIGITIITLFSSFIMTTLNGVLFVPLYFMAASDEPFKFGSYNISWGNVTQYWAVIYLVYLTGNIINYGLTSLTLIAIFKVKKIF